MVFCTLFDSNYLDKGLVLYRSLERVSDDFHLYIFCFDDRAYDILCSEDLPHTTIVRQKEIETDELLRVKGERSMAEYCWTCTPVIIEYVLDNFGVEDCTYIDPDMYFYSDPKILYEEIRPAGADVCICPHRYKDDSLGRRLEKRNGSYCVEFNYFCKTENSRKILKWWKDKCLEWCYDIPEDDRMGDQKYLDKMATFNGVYVLKNPGAGVAPWNLEKYGIAGKEEGTFVLEDRERNRFGMVFFHFQNIRYLSDRWVNIKSQTKDKKLKYPVYIPYLKEIDGVRRELLNKYGLDLGSFRAVRSGNRWMSFLQRYFAAMKLRSLSDLINLDTLDKLSGYEQV